MLEGQKVELLWLHSVRWRFWGGSGSCALWLVRRGRGGPLTTIVDPRTEIEFDSRHSGSEMCESGSIFDGSNGCISLIEMSD